MRCVRILGTVYQNEIQADRSRTLQGVLLTKFAKLALLIAILSLNLATAAAQTLTGTVTNGTTGKPAVGDEVIIINLANGMDVGGSTKTDLCTWLHKVLGVHL